MSYRRLFLLYSLILILLVAKHARAEHATVEPSTSPSASPTGTARPPAETTLRDKEVRIITEAFQTNEDFIRGHFGEKLPLALNHIFDGSEDDIATIMAEMAGTVNVQQLEAMEKEVERQLSDPVNSADPRYMELLKRLKWTKEVLKPTTAPGTDVPMCCSDPAFTKFKEAFLKAWDKTKAHNDEFYNKLDQALQGVQSAKEFLRSHYDPKALLAFIDAQRASGNAKLANDLTRALAFDEDTGTGQFLDAFGPGSSKDRIHLGNNPDKFADDLKTFSEKNNLPLNKVSFSPTKHPRPDREFRDGTQLPVASPVITTPPVTPPAGDDGAVTDTVAHGILQSKCVSCHGPGKHNHDDFALKADGSLEDPATADRVLARAVNGTGGFMPPTRAGGKLSDDLRARLKSWLNAKGVH